ncbi:hypothetical protein AGMMS4957_19750 [Bacteroidia bacterium]|nr:hypothetical protein AGMMS4957_19750 [Bacteroidia bacterium]
MRNKTTHKIINGDSRQMSELKDKSVHLVVTSPPYWQLKDGMAEIDDSLDFKYKNKFDYI